MVKVKFELCVLIEEGIINVTMTNGEVDCQHGLFFLKQKMYDCFETRKLEK